jgi:hypothetical protein
MHVRRFEANADHSSRQSNHRMRPFGGRPFEPPQTGRLNLFDLVHHKAQSRHVAAQLSQGVRR